MTRSINYTKLVMSVGMIVFLAAIVIGGTGAFFNDTETSTGNVFTAGAIDLKIDSVQHYNGMVCAQLPNKAYVWVPEIGGFSLDGENHAVATVNFDEQTEWNSYNLANPNQYPQAGVTCTGSWRLADDSGQPVIGKFWEFNDVKPGDNGENTISIHIENNDAWLCAAIDNIVDTDVTQTEPETQDPDDGDYLVSGELDSNLQFFAWVDEGSAPGFGQVEDEGEGDNIFQQSERVLGTASAASLSSQVWALAEGGDAPIDGGTTGYIGLAWCAGAFDLLGNCDGTVMGNEAQTDSWGADFKFYVEQSRNNPDFSCSEAGLLKRNDYPG